MSRRPLLLLFTFVSNLVVAFRGGGGWRRFVSITADVPTRNRNSEIDLFLMSTKTTKSNGNDDNLYDVPSLNFRQACHNDLPRCYEIESSSYPSDEAATLKSLTNRQKHAGKYFMMCTTTSTTNDNSDAITDISDTEKQQGNNEIIIGFVCGTRCDEFTEESMSEHNPTGRLLAIHSVVINEQYRRKGIGLNMMKQYIQNVMTAEEIENKEKSSSSHQKPIKSIVLIAKEYLLGFYVRCCGFRVNRLSPIVHGKDFWYELEIELPALPTAPATTVIRQLNADVTVKTDNTCSSIPRKLPRPEESWFCKTEQFCRPFHEILPHLEAHKEWVRTLRTTSDMCIVSGYRVDDKGNPGGGGLMFLASKSYEDAYEFIANNDPLIVNDCVDWELNGWIGQVGDISIR